MAIAFLQSAAARSLSLMQVLRLSDEEAFKTFTAIRWAETKGEPTCPKCQFSATYGTIFASRKLSIRDILAAIAVFTNGAKGHAALHLGRDLDVSYKTAFVLQHKLREALAAETKDVVLTGTVEIDGAYFGGHVKPANFKEARKDRRLLKNRTGKRKSVVVMRERGGRTLTVVASSEHAAIPEILARVAAGTVIHADEAPGWDALQSHYEMRRINHSICYSDGVACTNMAESFFSRLRRAELGTHHNIRKQYLGAYAAEMAWREDHRRQSNGAQFVTMVHAVTHQPVSRQWKGYWQRHLPK